MTNAVAYLRCSGESQSLGDTWDRQNIAISKYAATHDLDVLREFRDEGVTGKMELEGRAGLSECIQYVQHNGIGIVLVESSDRLARDMIVAEVVVREFQKIGVRVIAASSGIDLTEGDDSNPTAKLIRQILAAVAEFDRCVTVLKLKGARDRIRKEKGKCDGRHAFGDKPGEDITLNAMKGMRAAGRSYAEIACTLTRINLLTRYGKPWRASTIKKIMERKERKEQ